MADSTQRHADAVERIADALEYFVAQDKADRARTNTQPPQVEEAEVEEVDPNEQGV